MIRPTIEKIDKIIYKLKELQITIANIEDMPLEFPEYKKTDDKSLSVEQLISLAAGHGNGLSADEIDRLAESFPDTLVLTLLPPRELSRKVVAILPTLSMDTLKKLLKNDIPRLFSDDTVPKVKKQVGYHDSPFTEEERNLFYIQKAIDEQIKKNIEAAKAARRQKHVKPIINEIERVLFPYWDYFKEHGSYRLSENLILMEIIRQGNLSGLPEVINEFERIKYKLEVESQQSAPQKPAETEQENKDAKREREGMIQPKPPEIFQKILWIQKYGRKHWKLVTLAILIVLCIWIFSKINLFS